MPTLGTAIIASASALNAQRTRVEVAVSNIANADTTRGPNGQPYRRRDVVLQADQQSVFDNSLGEAIGVRVADIVEDRAPFQTRYEPSHPDADASGNIQLPNVDSQTEMVDMIGASRAYSANLAAITIVRDMLQKALDLGR